RSVRTLPATSHPAAAGGARAPEPRRLLALPRRRLLRLPVPRRVAGRRRAAPEPGAPELGRLAGARAPRARDRRALRMDRGAAPARAAARDRRGRAARRREAALIGLGVVVLLVLATNPFALLF